MSDIHSDDGMTVHGSRDKPVPVPLRDDYVEWEYREIGSKFGLTYKQAHKKLFHQSLLHKEGQMIDRVIVDIPEQGRNVFYFDVTENFNKRMKMFESANVKPFKYEEEQPGRNEPCPCNSGKKYKKCCMRKE